jgi:hypothetical protein
MIIENGQSRVYLGVHWIFDAFAVKENGDPDLKRNVGGVPLGNTIADDIFKSGMKKSKVPPRTSTDKMWEECISPEPGPVKGKKSGRR